MAKNKDTDILSTFASVGNDTIGLINRVDDATGKIQPGQRKGSIIKSAQQNIFEFPVFISNSIPIEYAEAVSSLLEQVYASYLQMAISINPVVDAESVKKGLQFANFKTDTNKYLECVDSEFQKDACHSIYQEGSHTFEFDLVSIEDSDARIINESFEYEPLSEFNHFFQEADEDKDSSYYQDRFPLPVIIKRGNGTLSLESIDNHNPTNPEFGVQGDEDGIAYGTKDEIEYMLKNVEDVYTINGNKTEPAFDAYMRFIYTNHMVMPSKNTIDEELDKKNRNTDNATYARNKDEREGRKDARENAKEFREIERHEFEKQTMAYKKAEETRKRAEEDRRRHGEQRASEKHRWDREKHDWDRSKYDADYGTRDGRVSYIDDIDNRRDVNAWNAEKARSPYYRTTDRIKTGADTVGSIASAVSGTTNAIYNVGTLGQRIKAEKLKTEKLKDEVENMSKDRAYKRSEINAKIAAKAPQYVDDSKCQKLNTMKPLLMQVTINMLNKDDSLQPINYIIGVKTRNRVIPSSVLPEVAKYPLKEMDKISRRVKWKAGELKFLKDLVFRIKEKKQTAADSRDPNRKWYRRLYELAHMKGDAPAAAVVQGKSLFATFIRDKQGKGKLRNGMIPNCSLVISQSDVTNIKNQTEINLLKGSTARTFCGELFLISLVVIDTDTESIKIMIPDMNNDYDIHSLGAVNKQLAMLDTAGQKTRDMFKLLG